MTEDFNQPSRKGSWLKAGALAAGILFLAGLSGWVIWRLLHHPDVPRDPAVQQEWKPSASNPALVLPAFEVQYRDLGESVELSIVSDANPIIYVDVNQNRTVDAGAISYAARPDNAVCVTHLDRPVDVHCGGEVSHASAAIENVGGSKRTVWNIPKRELQSGRRYADIVIQTFHEDTQQGEFYPQAALFQKVYRLDFAEEGSRAENVITLGSNPHADRGIQTAVKHPELGKTGTKLNQLPPAPPQIVDFSAPPVSADPSAGFRLKWHVLRADFIDIEPSPPGVVKAASGERLVMPKQTTTYVLTARNGTASTKLDLTVPVVPVAPPHTAKLSADSSNGVPGGGNISPKQDQSPPSPLPSAPQCASPCVTHISMAMAGEPIEPGAKLTKRDQRLAAGSNLIVTIQYAGAEPKRTTLEIDWYLGSIPVSYSPAFRLPASSGAISWPYNNQRVDPGEYKILPKLDGQPLTGQAFIFSVTDNATTH